jgi:hypothetical protein
MTGRISRARASLVVTLALVALCFAPGCASVVFERETQTSGTFRSSGLAFTILSIDLPKPALDVARENAADANVPNLVVEKVSTFPYLGWFDWLLDIVGVRYARISGTWGFAGEEGPRGSGE